MTSRLLTALFTLVATSPVRPLPRPCILSRGRSIGSTFWRNNRESSIRYRLGGATVKRELRMRPKALVEGGKNKITRFPIRYGPHPDQHGELFLPPKVERAGTDEKRWPLIVILHGGQDEMRILILRRQFCGEVSYSAVVVEGDAKLGMPSPASVGFWQNQYRKDLMTDMAGDIALSRLGAAWNLEYRRVGRGGDGGYPETFQDVAAAMDYIPNIASDYAIDCTNVVIIGHSAGGHLAAWTAMRSSLPPGAVGANPAIIPNMVISQSGVLDLRQAYERFIGGYAVPSLLGSSQGGRVDPAKFPSTSPYEMLPTKSKLVLLHPEEDKAVPLEMSERFHRRAEETGCDCTLEKIPGEGHFHFLDDDTRSRHLTMSSSIDKCRACLAYLQQFLEPDASEKHRKKEEDKGMKAFIAATNDPDILRATQKAFSEKFSLKNDTSSP
eukprot:jgi/Bigna1/77206/fgenesh1_pg.46_\